MAEQKTTIVVSADQVASARALIELAGGAEKVDPVIAKVARATPRRQQPAEDAKAS